jgi:hypothetical protein
MPGSLLWSPRTRAAPLPASQYELTLTDEGEPIFTGTSKSQFVLPIESERGSGVTIAGHLVPTNSTLTATIKYAGQGTEVEAVRWHPLKASVSIPVQWMRVYDTPGMRAIRATL